MYQKRYESTKQFIIIIIIINGNMSTKKENIDEK